MPPGCLSTFLLPNGCWGYEQRKRLAGTIKIGLPGIKQGNPTKNMLLSRYQRGDMVMNNRPNVNEREGDIAKRLQGSFSGSVVGALILGGAGELRAGR